MNALGSIDHAGDLRFVQDASGKRAEMSFDVTGAVGSIQYKASFTPKEGMLDRSVSSVSASQTLSIARADAIELHAAAQSRPGSNVAVANLTVSKAGTTPASFRGSILSRADAGGTLARVQGRTVGAILGEASFGGSLEGPHNITRTKDSGADRVDCLLQMQVSNRAESGAIGGVSTFTVGPSERILPKPGRILGRRHNKHCTGHILGVP